MTSPTGRTTLRPASRTRRWLHRLTTGVSVTTAAGLLLLGGPVSLQLPAEDDPDPALVSAEQARWPGRPGRELVRYRVRPGDTATGLAVRFHAWTDELRSVNRLGPSGMLVAGERIRIPVVVAAARRERARQHRHHRRAHRRARHHAHAHRPWRHADASRARVRGVIVRKARRHGVNPDLALAVSWQESGWQQRRRSSAGAVGAMQIMPDTGTWMSTYAGRRLNIYGLYDNVTAGVVLIKVLRAQTSRRHTVAAYYQGLGAVRRDGLYPSTRRYVRSVTALYRRIHRGQDPG